MVRECLAIAIGGMLGTLARHGLTTWAKAWNVQAAPVATLAVNVIGCFLIGYLFKWAGQREELGSWWEMALRVGFLGGLTTFSSFGLEVIQSWQARPSLAFGLIAAHLALGLGAVVLGMSLVPGPGR